MVETLIKERFFDGTVDEWLAQLPEDAVDKAVKFLEIDPDETMVPTGYSPISNDLFPHTAKICLWKDLVHVIHRWGMPSPSTLETSPAHLKRYVTNFQKHLSKASEVLKALEYQAMYDAGTITKEFKAGYGLRQVSEVMRANRGKTGGNFIAPLAIKQEYDSNGVWGKHYPIDTDIENASHALENIIAYTEKLLQDPSYRSAKQGTKKKGKDDDDTLVWALCHIYKKYTGEAPATSIRNEGTATGRIIPFLQLILPFTAYQFQITDWALSAKVNRLKGHKQHGSLWSVSKD